VGEGLLGQGGFSLIDALAQGYNLLLPNLVDRTFYFGPGVAGIGNVIPNDADFTDVKLRLRGALPAGTWFNQQENDYGYGEFGGTIFALGTYSFRVEAYNSAGAVEATITIIVR
jgi:hypothetical protein